MRNVLLDERTASDICKRVARLLKDLGDPTPPLRLELVRELLEFDLAYYSASDGGALGETVHRLKMAGKQVIRRPGLLLDVVRKLDLKALWVPDRKRILIDSDLPAIKQRWGEAHEVSHGILPWHEPLTHGDGERTLTLACQQRLEAEANYTAGQLLFLGDHFLECLRAETVDFDRVRTLSKSFGNSMTATLWRVVERLDIPAVGLVTQHPRQMVSAEPVKYFIRSHRFAAEFHQTSEMDLFNLLATYCHGNRGPIGRSEAVLSDANGDEHVFRFETFHNGHEALTLGLHRAARIATARVYNDIAL